MPHDVQTPFRGSHLSRAEDFGALALALYGSLWAYDAWCVTSPSSLKRLIISVKVDAYIILISIYTCRCQLLHIHMEYILVHYIIIFLPHISDLLVMYLLLIFLLFFRNNLNFSIEEQKNAEQ